MKQYLDTKKITEDAFRDELTKIADFLDPSDIDDALGLVLNKRKVPEVQELIDAAKGRSFFLRHPILTGIPTLGLAPAIAHALAVDKISRTLQRDDPKLALHAAGTRQNKLRNQHIFAAGALAGNL